jgi:Zn-dependent peptidase ImmA (M78 family)
MAPREDLARRTANTLLDELSITAAPVDPEWIVYEKQLLFEEADFPPTVYGALFRSGDRFGVIVSRSCPGEGHRRFTIAHELGHYHIPDHVDRLFSMDMTQVVSLGGHFRSAKDPFEVEADCFANELLMPDRFVRPMIRKLAGGLVAVRALAEQFRTSLSAAAIRYAAVADEPVVVIVSKDGVIEWASRPPMVWAHDWARKPLKKEWAPRRSATRRLGLNSDRVRRGDEDHDSTLLCEWFDGAPNRLEVAEEAVGLGAYGRVLTVLRIPDLPDPDEAEERDVEPSDWRDALRGYRLGD